MTHMGSGPNNSGPMNQNDANMELQRHIRQNNDRLRCIQKHLQTHQGFHRAAKELLEWCSDPRAFQKAFEDSLMACLTVISEVASKPGFDLSLGYRLLAICAGNRNKFSPKSSNMLNCWSNDLGNLLLLQQSKQRQNEGVAPGPGPSPGSHMGMNNYPPPLGQQRYPEQNWNNSNGPPGIGSNQPSHVGMGPPRQQSAVSVITTVWGVTNPSQTQQMTQNSHGPSNNYPPHNMNHMPSTNTGRSHNQSPGYHPQMNNFNGPLHHGKMGSYESQGNSYPRQDQYSNPMNGPHKGLNGLSYGPTKSLSGHHMSQDNENFAQPAAAAAAAAVAAAAATATATATATLIANDQQQQHNDINSYDPMAGQNNPNAGPNMHGHNPHRPLQGVHSGGPYPVGDGMDMRNNFNPSMNMNRGHPRPNIPPQYSQTRQNVPPINNQSGMMQRGTGYSGMSGQYRGPYNQPPYPHSQYNGTSNLPDFKQPNNSPHPGYGPRTPMGTSSGAMHHNNDMYPASSSAPPGSYFPPGHHQPNSPHIPNQSYNRQPYSGQFPPYRSSVNSNMGNNTNSPLNQGSVPPYPQPDIKPMIPSQLDVKPHIPLCGDSPMSTGSVHDIKPNPAQLQAALMENDDLRLTFPVRDGIVLQPFRLEHNLPRSTHMFQLKAKVFDTLRWRPDLELQFKCYHHEDRMMYTNWPHSVQVSVNDASLQIPRNPVHKPLCLKNVCKEGKNIISITVSTCCCSHLFVLQLVHRPSVRSVIKGLLQKRLLPAQHCITKIRRFFHNGTVGGIVNSPNNGINNLQDGGNSITISLLCPITLQKIHLPARGHDCKHIQCFDLASYLQLNCDKGSWTCPVCKKNALLEGLEVDQYTWTILKHMQDDTSTTEVTIDSNCTWRPIQHIKQEIMVKEEPDAPPSKRFKSGMSPSSMLDHLPSPGSYVPMMTPLPQSKPQSSSDNSGFNNMSYSGCGMNSSQNHTNSSMHNTVSGVHPQVGKTLSMSELNDNIAANDKVLIERRINHAVTNPAMISNTNSPMRTPNTPLPQTPGTPMRPPSTSNVPGQASNVNMPSNTSSAPARTPSAMPSTSGTPSGGFNNGSKPLNTGVGLSPTNRANECNTGGGNILNNLLQNNGSNNQQSITNADLSFDPESVINGDGDNSEAIPSLDILPENTDPMELFGFLGSSESNGPSTSSDDIFKMFDS